ncbi:MAG TPA: mannitol-1-phosphate 5-dehydrogenase [Armatimonadota bacterium]|jgi:mannitol-1-phosphate 5-dehydrogenase
MPNPVKRAVQFGAGNIGRGFLGQLYYESGYHTTFIDVDQTLVDALNARGEYPLRIVDEQTTTLAIGNVSAIHGSNLVAVSEALAEADIAATAVGVSVMDRIGASLAAGLAQRFERIDARPLDVIVCENMIGAGPFMREVVRRSLDSRFHADLDAKVGFVEASIGRMVPVMSPAVRAEDPLLVEVEAYCELPVDASGFRGPIPSIVHLQPKADFGAYVERKLFVHNLGHAAAAYLGRARGHAYIWQAVEDPAVLPVVRGAMAETCLGLSRRHGLDLRDLHRHADDLLRRFHNKALGDQVARVARDPIRKLGPNDRLIGAARMCMGQGVEPVNVCRAIRAAIEYEDASDAASMEIANLRREGGPGAVLRRISGLEPGSALWDLLTIPKR